MKKFLSDRALRDRLDAVDDPVVGIHGDDGAAVFALGGTVDIDRGAAVRAVLDRNAALGLRGLAGGTLELPLVVSCVAGVTAYNIFADTTTETFSCTHVPAVNADTGIHH